LRVKINTVALKGSLSKTNCSISTDWCASRDIDLTFIEVMPPGDNGNEDRFGQ
jgi:cyclic pyranopterin phosphate synthase